jgi:branched-chain amino acid transport system substrate-binding protein
MLKRIAVLLALSAMTGLGLAQEPITIGVNLELSGRFATIGTSTLQGIQAAQEQMPTVDGRQVELSICDNQTTPEGSINCAARYAADDLGAERATVFRQKDDDYGFGLAGFCAEGASLMPQLRQ